MLHVTIDGQPHALEPGGTVLDALRAVGVEVPALCHDPRMVSVGACRLCIVEVTEISRPVASCTTPLADGMDIHTHSPSIEAQRRVLLGLLAQDYPADAVARFPDKPFHHEVRTHGLEDVPCGTHSPLSLDDSHPYLHVDMSQCIYCYRCVRICDELQGQFVWRVWNRGAETRILPDSGTTMAESSCVSCGACADSCPTGAIEDKTILTRGEPVQWTRTTCPYCGVGCELNLGTRDGRPVQARPVQDAPVNKGHLCVKGRYAFDFVHSRDRVTTPLLREGSHWREASWEEALGYIAERLRRIVERDGPDSTGVLGSARATNEENYLTQKFARVVLGTHNVDCCARVCHSPSAAALGMMFGTGASTNSFDDIECARTLMVCGSNATENHPVVGARIKQAALRGARLIVVDPRRIELADYATVHLRLRPGTNVPLFNAMAWTLVEEGLVDEAFLRERVDGWEAFQEFLRDWTPEKAQALCGVDAELIRRAARLYGTEKPSLSVHGLGMTEHVQGTESVMCLANLALLTGNLGKPGTGVNPLRGQNNVQGSAHMGCEPHRLTGYVPVEQGRARFEQRWGVPLPTTSGLDLMEMMDAARAGKLKALWAIGYDILLTNPAAEQTRESLRRLELLVAQDMFMNETAREFGTVFLPACSAFEKDGTFMNAERRIQRVRKALEPLGQSRPDWEIVRDLARAMGRGEAFDFHSAEDIWNEVRTVWLVGAGISYARLESGGLQWPCPSEDHPGTRILHTQGFTSGPRAGLRCIPFKASPEAPSEAYPFILVTGRTLYQFNAGTMTMRTPNVELRPTDELEMHPDDARRLGLADGERVRVHSQYGEAELPLKLNTALQEGQLFTTFHTARVFINEVTSPHRDGYTHTPEYKVTAVRVEKAPLSGGSSRPTRSA